MAQAWLPNAEAPARTVVHEFVKTPFAVRCNIVKVWRRLPEDLWEALNTPAEVLQSIRRERLAMFGAIMAGLVIVACASVGYHYQVGEKWFSSPLIGSSRSTWRGLSASGEWYLSPGQSLGLTLWVVLPPLLGWACVRGLWIPWVAAKQATREATLSFARHLSGVYLYVYAMILVGVGLMALLVRAAPVGTEAARYYLWWFLFGESFFVPAAMWLRLVLNDRSGRVFGRSRHVFLAGYMILFVAVPCVGMLFSFA